MKWILPALALALLAVLWILPSGRGPDDEGRHESATGEVLASDAPREPTIEDSAPSVEAQATRAPVAPSSAEPATLDGADGLFHGIVLDAFGGGPIDGAEVRVGAPGRVVPVGEGQGASVARTDVLGRFVLSGVPAGTVSEALVEAEGFGPSIFPLASGHDTPERALVLRLVPAASASLVVQARSLDGRALEGVEVEVRWPNGYRPSLGGQTFGGAKESWRARTDPSGLAFLAGLVAEEELVWSVGEGPARRTGNVVLVPDRTKRLEVVLDAGVVLRGCARDEYGLPVAGLGLWLWPAGTLGTVSLRGGPLAKALTDGDGRFEFSDLACGAVRLDLGPTQEGFVLSDDMPLALDRPVVEHDLALVHGGFLTGQVTGEGKGAGALEMVVARSSEGDSILEQAMEGSEFRLGPLPPGAHDVFAFGDGQATETRRALAGTSGLELSLLGSREVAVRIEGAGGWIQLVHTDGEHGEEATQFRASATEGEPATTTLSLPFGTHSLLASSDEGGVAFLGHLRLGAEETPPEVRLRLRPGIPCTFVHRAGSARGELRLRLDGAPVPGMFLFSDGLAPGASRTLWLPPGELEAELLVAGRVAARATRVLRPDEGYRIELTAP